MRRSPEPRRRPRAASKPKPPPKAPPPPRERRKERRHGERRAALLAAAREVLVRDGIANFTVAAVADVADVSKPAVFYYFPTREHVIAELALDLLAAEAAAQEQAIAAAPTGVEALAAVVRARLAFFQRDLTSFRIAYVWPQLVTLPEGFVKTRIYPIAWRVNAQLEARLKEDAAAGRLAADAHPRKLANLAWLTAQGILSLAAGLEAAGGSTGFTVEELGEEAVRALRRAAVA